MQEAVVGRPSPKRLQNRGGFEGTPEDWRGLDGRPRALSLNHLMTNVARHQFVGKVVRTNPPFGTNIR
jgi:hypothetical protein